MPRRRLKAVDWRTISVEIAIIVVGVLIALGADQAVRSLHGQRQVVDAKSDFQSELTESLFAAMERVKLESCVERQLSALNELASLPGTVAVEGYPSLRVRTWSSTIWESGISSGAVSQMPADERAAYASNYALVKRMGDFNMKEFELLSELNTLSRPTVITEVAQDRLRLTIAKLRDFNAIMALVSRQLIEGLAAMGVRLTPENEKLLRETDNTCAMPRRVT